MLVRRILFVSERVFVSLRSARNAVGSIRLGRAPPAIARFDPALVDDDLERSGRHSLVRPSAGTRAGWPKTRENKKGYATSRGDTHCFSTEIGDKREKSTQLFAQGRPALTHGQARIPTADSTILRVHDVVH